MGCSCQHDVGFHAEAAAQKAVSKATMICIIPPTVELTRTVVHSMSDLHHSCSLLEGMP